MTKFNLMKYILSIAIATLILSSSCQNNNNDDDDFQGYYLTYEANWVPYSHTIAGSSVYLISGNSAVVQVGDSMEGVTLEIEDVQGFTNHLPINHRCTYFKDGIAYKSIGDTSNNFVAQINTLLLGDTILQGRFSFRTKQVDSTSYYIRLGEFRVRVINPYPIK